MPCDETDKDYLNVHTNDIKLVCEYTLLDFNQVVELDCYTFRILLRDSIIYKLRQTEDGVDYLENAYILSQSSPNKALLRDKFKNNGE